MSGYESDVDAILKTWRQGDAIIGQSLGFLYVADLSKPLSPSARREADSGFAEGENLTSIGSEVPGFVVVTQTCDLLKACAERPFVHLAALQQVADDFAKEVQKGMRPCFACVPALMDRRLVANLDLLMTVEKSVVADVSKRSIIRGVRSDAEARQFAESVSRRFLRFAFPDDFVAAVRPIQKRIRDKHGRKSNEGRSYSKLREIRVFATPAWDSPQPDITFLFIRNEEDPVTQEFERAVGDLMGRFQATGSFNSPRHRILSLAEMTAAAYVESDPLDLDYLSHSTNSADTPNE
jgi:hypothetical protein